ncbi:LLM class flavin-dependent oxidoreductase [Alicyclobacillus mali (ex Roth et al. 2021)]|uniref:LLM class flavin-dependent oxidoreductase n=1 Tax=Alicyclobacillus mali (ex Roth et al. 2021) TaxID=1123961 RepID=UPI001A8D285E|nr:LLM class flavin-dependent oxidoreductase [Alicyclobacillus mali (ex Roth et al. 2021)]
MDWGLTKGETALSVLDLVPITEGSTPAEAFQRSAALAQHAERLGYRRFWVAEHHSMPGIASSATAVVIAYLAQHTRTIRVGSGGVMLPNHAPLVVAEQFGTLASMFPGRIDLGLGRAPGTDAPTIRALGGNPDRHGHDFPERLAELMRYFHPPEDEARRVHAVPGEGMDIPIWLLGSSDFSARLAAELGLPFAYASHFAPDYLMIALETYRANFRPSQWLKEPYAMVGAAVVAAPTDEEARFLATSSQLQQLSLIRGKPSRLKPPVERVQDLCSPYEWQVLQTRGRLAIVGGPDTVRNRLRAFVEATKADEVIITSQIYDHAARLQSFEIVADVMRA